MSNTDHPVRYALSLGERLMWVREVRGTEKLSETFRFEIEVSLEAGDPLDLDAVVGAAAILQIRREDDVIRTVTGVLTEVERNSVPLSTATTWFRCVLEPRVARLRFRQDIRVFRDQTAIDVVEQVWRAGGVDVERRLRGSYAVRGYNVQMRESDLDFGKRLLEDEGVFWFSTEDGTVVLADSGEAWDEHAAPLPYRDAGGLEQGEEGVVELGTTGEIVPRQVTLRDFNPEHPSLDMDVDARGPWAEGPFFYDYPGEYELPPEGSRKARIRAEALDWRFKRLAGRTTAAWPRVGEVIRLTDLPDGFLDDAIVPTRIDHRWRRTDDSFDLAFESVARDVTPRPWPTTHVPALPNPLTGFVTGPAGEDIHTDVWGRVKVHFPWDRLQPKDDHCSDWVPVIQDNTGHSSAMPRIGWEVLCHFLEGDPDRPVVLGRVYNGADEMPEKLPLRKTATALRSHSSPGRVGRNVIRFEDAAGEEQIWFKAERDKNIVVVNDKTERVDSTEGRRVRGHEQVAVGVDQKIVVHGNMSEGTDTNRTETIGADRKIDVGDARGDNVGKDHSLTIGGSHLRKMGEADGVTTNGSMRESVGGVILEASVKDNRLFMGRISALVVGGGIFELAKDSRAESAGRARGELVGGIVLGKAEERIATRVGKTRKTLAGGSYTVEATKEVILNAFEKLTTKSTTAELKGSKQIKLKVGDTEVTLGDGSLGMKSTSTISISTTAENKLAAAQSAQNPPG